MVHRETSLGPLPDESNRSPVVAPGGIVIGTLAGIDPEGRPLVVFAGSVATEPLVALSTVGVGHDDAGRKVALLFAHGDARQPVIMGLIHSPLHEMLANFDGVATGHVPAPVETNATSVNAVDATIDGQRVVIEAKEEIVLKCGESSITLTRAGKILIRGQYLQSRAAGMNRILGGSVQIN